MEMQTLQDLQLWASGHTPGFEAISTSRRKPPLVYRRSTFLVGRSTRTLCGKAGKLSAPFLSTSPPPQRRLINQDPATGKIHGSFASGLNLPRRIASRENGQCVADCSTADSCGSQCRRDAAPISDSHRHTEASPGPDRIWQSTFRPFSTTRSWQLICDITTRPATK